MKFGIKNKDDIIAARLTPLWHTGSGQVKELNIGLNIDNVINNELSRIVKKPYVVAKIQLLLSKYGRSVEIFTRK